MKKIKFLPALLNGTMTLLLFAANLTFAQTPEKKGEYLATAGDCISCHTAPGGQPFAGGLRMNTPFGYLLTPNITPDVKTGIGSWSKDEFFRAIHDGVNKKDQDMYPAMPFTSYAKVSREDVDAIYAYLQTIKPVSHEISINHLEFPFNIRSTMLFWRELFFTPGFFKPDPYQSASWNRGAYLVEGLGHCSECHSPRNVMGAIEQSKAFTGTLVDGWFALNLTSNLRTGLGSWTAQDIANYLKSGKYPGKTTALGPMQEVVHNSTSKLSDSDLLAMGVYLKTLPASSSLNNQVKTIDKSKIEGARLYIDNCSGCHQSNGRGIQGVIPPLASNPAVIAPNGSDIVKVIIRGIGSRNGYIPMPSFASRLNDEEIAQLSNYVRGSWGNSASPNVTQSMVKSIRANPEI
ncbi:mono/diheme cytochrome c family protein [Polynucleobacter sphagniphilus]|uniref:c-type cytochrome n=1 Tax=Polynucleobacter sphagniphilus TaxID=1743169 RepID=UPI002473E6E7|nr:cytochrome c [Polynucleobacter sphagniphilus]MDH6302930.1 mono/diheme cytochrome c family protein [Polynucleobacter sphagniphilus]